MRRRLRIQVIFEPARLSADHLRNAYGIVAPIAKREVRAPMAGHDEQPRGHPLPRQEGKVA
jgi:hypothetical protein